MVADNPNLPIPKNPHRTPECAWKDDEDGNWWTACGEGWVFTDGGPTGNGMNYCPFRGRPLAEVPNA